MLYQATPSHISYRKDSTGLVEEKFILPIYIPGELVTAIDIGDLPEPEVLKITQLQRDYSDYLAGIKRATFGFEDWVEHTTGEQIKPKWRSYKVANILKSD